MVEPYAFHIKLFMCEDEVTYSVLEQLGGLVIVFSLCKCCRSSLAMTLGKGGSPEFRNKEVKKLYTNLVFFFHRSGTQLQP